jgi:hypothetical protein
MRSLFREIKHLLTIFPLWVVLIVAGTVVGMIFGISYTFSKCGAEAFFMGNGAGYAAISGMCDR